MWSVSDQLLCIPFSIVDRYIYRDKTRDVKTLNCLQERAHDNSYLVRVFFVFCLVVYSFLIGFN